MKCYICAILVTEEQTLAISTFTKLVAKLCNRA